MIYKRKVWLRVKKSTIPENRRLIGCKWVFKKKGNGVYRARLCAIGYTQVPRIDHGFAFAPVVGENTFRLVLVIGLFNGWIMEIVDVESDLKDYGGLTKDERHFISHILAFFVSSDGIVYENLAGNFAIEITIIEA